MVLFLAGYVKKTGVWEKVIAEMCVQLYELLCFMFPTTVDVRMHPLPSAVLGYRLICSLFSQPPAEICVWRLAKYILETRPIKTSFLFTFCLCLFTYASFNGSRNSANGVATGLRAGLSAVRILLGAKDFSLRSQVDSGSGTHPASYQSVLVFLLRG